MYKNQWHAYKSRSARWKRRARIETNIVVRLMCLGARSARSKGRARICETKFRLRSCSMQTSKLLPR